MYPHYDDWLDVYCKLNASGAFDSPFTRHVGIFQERFGP